MSDFLENIEKEYLNGADALKEVEKAKIPPLKLRCIKCGLEKPLNSFHNCKKGKYGKFSYCKDCKKIANDKSYAKNPEIQKYKALKWNASHREKTRVYNKNYAKRERDKAKKIISKEIREIDGNIDNGVDI